MTCANVADKAFPSHLLHRLRTLGLRLIIFFMAER